MRSVALANQKGGVGKTTTAIHLAHGLALYGASVALLDLDPQGNATLAVQGMALPPDPASPDLADRALPAELDALRPIADRFWILPSPGAERPLDRDARPNLDKLTLLRNVLEEHSFDWLLVDCPPRMDHWGLAGVRLCRQVVVPVQTEFLAMHGLTHMLRSLDQARREFSGCGELLGVLATMHDDREGIMMEVMDDLQRNLGEALFDAVIYRDPMFIEAASHGRTLFDYAICTKGARSYGELVREVVHGREASR